MAAVRTPKKARRSARPRARRTQPQARRSPWRRVAVGGLLGAGCLAAACLTWLWRTAGQPAAERAGYTAVTVSASDSIATVSQVLVREGLVPAPRVVWWVKQVFFPRSALAPGVHWLQRGSSPRQLVQSLVRSVSREKTRVSLPEGWDSFQIAERLASQGVCAREAFLGVVHDAEHARQRLQQASLEGYLYPATYEFLLDSAPEVTADRLLDEGLKRFDAVLEGKEAQLAQVGGFGLSEFELISLASIVQKEAADRDEYARIASVFLNRLSDPNFRPARSLQSDPTAAYGCKLYPELEACRAANGHVTREILRDPNNPYNSYKHPGLPPGPIGNPSSDVLTAILSAPSTDALFFFAPRGGRHTFSRSLDEHNAAIGRSAKPLPPAQTQPR
jgi:UPF0755 protein